MDLVRAGLLLGLVASAYAQQFSLDIGNAVASKAVVKTAGMAVRANGCSEASIIATGVRMAGGTRVTFPLIVSRGERTNIWGVGPSNENRAGGAYLAVVAGDCNGSKAGALVPFDARGLYNREKTRLLSHVPTSAEIEEALKEMD